MQDHSSDHEAFYTLFDTPIGFCGLAWNGRGVIGVQLPEDDHPSRAAALPSVFRNREAPPPSDIQASFQMWPPCLRAKRGICPPPAGHGGRAGFRPSCVRGCSQHPAGPGLTYGEIASRLGVDNARTIGQALGRNPFAIIVPCHRVVAAEGKLGGFSANGGATTKRRLLAIEGAET